MRMQPSKSVSSDSTLAPLASGCSELRHRDLAARQDHDRRDAGGGAVGGERRRGVAGRGAGDGADAGAFGEHLPHHRDEHGHAEVLERSGVRVAALLDPEILDADRAAEALGPQHVGAALVHRDDALVGQARAAPTPSCPTPPSRTARWCACSGRRTGASTPTARDPSAPPRRARPRGDRRTSGSGRAASSGVFAGATGDAAEPGAVRHESLIPERSNDQVYTVHSASRRRAERPWPGRGRLRFRAHLNTSRPGNWATDNF